MLFHSASDHAETCTLFEELRSHPGSRPQEARQSRQSLAVRPVEAKRDRSSTGVLVVAAPSIVIAFDLHDPRVFSGVGRQVSACRRRIHPKSVRCLYPTSCFIQIRQP